MAEIKFDEKLAKKMEQVAEEIIKEDIKLLKELAKY